MKKIYPCKLSFALFSLVFISQPINAQLSGTVTVPGTYTSIAAAVNDINIQPIVGPLTVLIAPGFTETAPVGGYSLTATGTATNPIIFQKNGAGVNPLLIAYTGGVGTPATALQDGIFRFNGSDYIIIDGIDLNDPNTSNPSTMEFGYGFFKTSSTNGCQNNIIKNCTITLNRINNAIGAGPVLEGSQGIEVVNASSSTHTTIGSSTSPAGSHSNNKFYSNTIQNCNIGIGLAGFFTASPSTLSDTGNDVGGNSAATGNTILNYGGAPSVNTATGVRTLAQFGVNISFNVINNNNGAPGANNHPNTLRGIYIGAATSANATVNNNTITVKGAGTSATVAAIENAAGATPASNTITINNNLITGSSYSTATSGGFYYILNNATAANVEINSNRMTGLILNPAAGTGLVGFIYNNVVVGTSLSILSNTIENTTNLNTTGNIYGFYTSNATQNYTIQNNYVNNISRTGGLSGNFYGVYNNNNSATGGTALIDKNTFSNLSQGSTSVLYGVFQSSSLSQNEIISNNLFNTINCGSGTSYIIYHSYGNSLSAISSNTVSNITSIGNVTGIFYGNTSAVSLNVNNNLVFGMSTSASSNIAGIWQLGGSLTYSFKNKIYDITGNGTASNAYGMYFVSGGNNYIYDNIIGDIKAPVSSNPATQNCIAGLFIQGGSNYYINYNTVRIDAASGGTSFYSSAIYAYTIAAVSLRNNIFINNSVSNSGVATAYRRNGNNLGTYSVSSNNNSFYCGGPGTSYIFWDNVTPRPTLSTYTTFVSPKDANSVTENTTFLSLTGSSPNFLHVDPLVATVVESGAVNISGITDDFDNDIRQGNPGYIGTGTAPDIGADEFNMVVAACSTVTPATISPVSQTKCAGQTASFTGTGATSGSGVVYQWQVATTSGGPYSNVVGGIGMNSLSGYTTAALSAGTYYYVLMTTCTASSLTAISNEATLTVTPPPAAPGVISGLSSLCTGAGAGNYSVASVAGATSYSWTLPGIGWSGSSTTNSINLTPGSGSGNLSVIAINACGSSTASVLSITVTPTPTVNAGASQTITCTFPTVTLNGSGATTYTWSGPGIVSGSNTANPVVNAAGSYSLTGSNGSCNSNVSVVNVAANTVPPSVSIGSSTAAICSGGSATLTATGANSYSWSTGSTNTVIVVSPTVSTGYTVTGTNTLNGCTGIANTSLFVSSNPTLTATPSSTSLCSGGTATIVGGGGNTYTWIPTFQTTSTIIVSPTSTTTYTLLGNNSFGCGSSTIITIPVYSNPTVTVNSGTICSGQSFTIIPGGASSYTYQGGNSVVSPTVTASYTVVGTNTAGCVSSSATSNIIVNNAPSSPVSLNGSTVTCIGSPTGYNVSPVSGATSYVWSLPSGWSGSSTNNNIIGTPGASGILSVTATNSCGTSAPATLSVTVNPLPTVSIVTSASIICGPPYQGTATIAASGASTYLWNTSATTTAIAVSPSVTTTYTVTGTDVNGCINSTSFTQSVSACTSVLSSVAGTSEFVVYPNPTSSLIIVKAKAGLQINVYNAIGESIINSELKTDTIEIDLSDQANGIYFIRIGTFTTRVIKE